MHSSFAAAAHAAATDLDAAVEGQLVAVCCVRAVGVEGDEDAGEDTASPVNDFGAGLEDDGDRARQEQAVWTYLEVWHSVIDSDRTLVAVDQMYKNSEFVVMAMVVVPGKAVEMEAHFEVDLVDNEVGGAHHYH
jgi:hypothetical protein